MDSRVRLSFGESGRPPESKPKSTTTTISVASQKEPENPRVSPAASPRLKDSEMATSDTKFEQIHSMGEVEKENKRVEEEKKAQEAKAAPIPIPASRKSTVVSPVLEAKSLGSLSKVPVSRYLYGRSHYTGQPITIEYFVTEKVVSGEVKDFQAVKKQATTIRSIGDYQLIRTIGSGSTGKVKLAVNIRNQQKVAIKIISRKWHLETHHKSTKETPASRERRILREAAILNLAHHPNVVKLFDLYVTDDYFCMIFEYVDGGQMLDYIISHGKLKESVARKFFKELLSAVSYCHRNGIVHRDLKIENVLIDSQGDIKLVDFGLSNFYNPREQLKTFCGSLYFAAPELLSGKLYTGPEVDVWSLGIILYVLVCGRVPFDDKSLSALHEKIKSGQFLIPSHLSPECRNLLSVMIEVDPMKRARLNEVIGHPWTLKDEGFGMTAVKSFEDFYIERGPLSSVDEALIAFMTREFAHQYSSVAIASVLKDACKDWQGNAEHPIISLYYLAAEKREREMTSPMLSRQSSIRTTGENERLEVISEVAHSEGAFVRGGELSTMTETEGNKFVPASSLRTTRKRAESLPGEPVPFVTPGKSSRATSLQTTPSKQSSSTPQQISVRTVYLRGIFSVNTTSTRSPNQIRDIIISILTERHSSIIFLDRESYFICEYQASIQSMNRLSTSTGVALPVENSEIDDEDDSGREMMADTDRSQSNLQLEQTPTVDNSALTFGAAPFRSIRFEIHIVKVALLGMYGVQFKRVQGDFSVYKNLCAQLLSEFNL